MSFWSKLKQIVLFQTTSPDDEAFFDTLEENLILADCGVETATEAVEMLRSKIRKEKISGQEEIRKALQEILTGMLELPEEEPAESPMTVILVIGVNGVGKTTSIGKLAKRYSEKGKRVMLCAADTFRAAAADQLQIWAERAGVELVRQYEGADPGAVLFDALQAAKARKADIVLCDTAGRLHNKENLMNELAKLRRIIDRETPDARKEVFLVLDGTTGQNGLIQAKQFKETAGLTGIVLTKLDGTAKGGIVIPIARELGIPVRYVGLGEGIDDLQAFDAEEYVKALV